MEDIKQKKLIYESPLISRDLSWLQFNYRVLDQAAQDHRTIFDRLKFLAITQSNLDEFFMVRVGSLYNYLDYGKKRVDYCGLRERPFRKELLQQCQEFVAQQHKLFQDQLKPEFSKYSFNMVGVDQLNDFEKEKVENYFSRTIYPMLTPMLYDGYHSFPTLMNENLILGVVTLDPSLNKSTPKASFVQLPNNLPRFFEINRAEELFFVPIEEIVRWKIYTLFKNVEVLSASLFRLNRNADISLSDVDDVESDFLEEVKSKLTTRRTARVVKIDLEEDTDPFLVEILKQNCEMEELNLFYSNGLIDYNGLWQIVGHPDFQQQLKETPKPVPPLGFGNVPKDLIFERLMDRDCLLHHPYNTMEPVLQMLEQAAQDPYVLAIKITIYRLASNSRVTDALLKAAENGKHVSVLFELKARFDEENNIREAERLRKAGCYVIYGMSNLKTHTKLLLIIRQENDKVHRFVHMASGNYNEKTSSIYTDLAFITSKEAYAADVSEFFNKITGHSKPDKFINLITAPEEMRPSLINLVNNEINNAKAGKESRIVIKANSLEDREMIEALYEASNSGVKIDLIVRGICCLRPGRAGLSENIKVRSIVGDYLEHSRVYYFHNLSDPIVFSGSADVMTRSFDRRVESLFRIFDEVALKRAVNLLAFNLKDNVNAYQMQEDGSYHKIMPKEGETLFNLHVEFYKLTEEIINNAQI